jgi:fumarylacetoacetate (FAA) hydrolase
MKLVTYLNEDHDQLGLLVDGLVYDMENIHPDLPGNMSMFLAYWEDCFPVAQAGVDMIREGRIGRSKGKPVESLELLAPVPYPPS